MKHDIFNLEAEQIVLGGIIQDGSLNGLEGANLKPEDYFDESHKVVYAAILKLYKENREINIINLAEQLRKDGVLKSIGGLNAITYLTTIVPHNATIKHCVDIVKDLSNKRKLVDKLTETIENIEKIDNKTIIDDLDEAKNIMADMHKFESMFSNFSDIEVKKDIKALSTGFTKLDRAINGLQYGSLTVLTGEPSTGKSTVLNQIIANTIANNEKVFLYSGELPGWQLKKWFFRTVANEKHLSEFTGQYGAMYEPSGYAKELINKWVNNKLFVFNDEQKPSESNLIGSITYLAKYKGVRLIVLDNLMTMITDNPTDNEYKKQKYLVNNLKNLAKKYELVIILVAHANKESRKNITPNMFDVSGASEIVNLSDYVFKTVRDIKKDDNGNIESEDNFICILKNRNASIQGVSLRTYFDIKRKRFYTDEGDELEKDYGYDLREQQQFQEVDMDIPF